MNFLTSAVCKMSAGMKTALKFTFTSLEREGSLKARLEEKLQSSLVDLARYQYDLYHYNHH